MIQTELEGNVKDWLDNFEIQYNFESVLLGGRHEWSGLQVPFVIPQAGLAFRILDDVNPPNPEDRAIIENFGYRVVDLEEVDLRGNFDIVMLKALQGEEMSPIDSGLYKEGLYASQGFEPHPSDTSGKILSSQTYPEVRTDELSNVSSGEATLNGTLTYDGGFFCKTRFHYGDTSLDLSPLCILFPWSYHSLINLYSPEIPLSFVSALSNFTTTKWTLNLITNDTFNEDVNVSDGWHTVKTEAENQLYNVKGNEKLVYVGD
jgi:hypothetical protein